MSSSFDEMIQSSVKLKKKKKSNKNKKRMSKCENRFSHLADDDENPRLDDDYGDPGDSMYWDGKDW